MCNDRENIQQASKKVEV